MATNTQRYGGLRRLDNGRSRPRVELVLVTSSDTHPTGVGDPMQMAAGNPTKIGGSPYVNTVVQGTATSAVYGVCQNVCPQINDGTAQMDLTKVYRAASTNGYINVEIATPDDRWLIQDDGALPGMASGHLNYNYKFIAADCDTTSGLSKFTIDSANGATTATYPMHVVCPYDVPGNDYTLGYATWVVTLNNDIRSGGTGTAGV